MVKLYMNSDESKELLDWIFKAEEHEKFARSILTHKDAPAWGVAFFSQQMAELSLKGLQLFHGKKLIKTHDLIELKNSLADDEPELLTFQNDFKLLNGYYIENRYPGDYPEIAWPEAEQALSAALRIKDFVINKIEKKAA